MPQWISFCYIALRKGTIHLEFIQNCPYGLPILKTENVRSSSPVARLVSGVTYVIGFLVASLTNVPRVVVVVVIEVGTEVDVAADVSFVDVAELLFVVVTLVLAFFVVVDKVVEGCTVGLVDRVVDKVGVDLVVAFDGGGGKAEE